MNVEEVITKLARNPGTVSSFEAAEAKLRDQEAEAKRLREALAAIKSIVVGDKHPNWTDQHTTTMSRGRIADICDLS